MEDIIQKIIYFLMLICSTLTMIEGNPVLKNMIQIYWLALANKCLRGMKKHCNIFLFMVEF